MSAANMLGSRVFCALFGAVTGQMPNSVSPSLMPSSTLDSFDQVFVVSSMSVPPLMAACAAENNLDDYVDHGLFLYLVGKNDTFFVSSGSLDSCLEWCAAVKSSISGLARSSHKSGKAVPGQLAKFLLCFLPQVIGIFAAAFPYLFKMMDSAATWAASAFLRLSTLVGLLDMVSMSAGALLVLGTKLFTAAASQTALAAAWKNSACVLTLGWSLALGVLFWTTIVVTVTAAAAWRFVFSLVCLLSVSSVGFNVVFSPGSFLGTLVCLHVLGLRIVQGNISLVLPFRRPLHGGVLGLRFVEGNISSMLPFRCVFLLFECIGELVVGLATTTLDCFLSLEFGFCELWWNKGPSLAAAASAAATPRLDVEKGPQAAAAPLHMVVSSQVPSRCLSEKHPVLFDNVGEDWEDKVVCGGDGDTVVLVRGLQGNTIVVRCGSGWTALDLSASLRGRTSVPVHLFYLVVEGRVLGDHELVSSLGRDCVVSMRGRVLGGSRNVSPIPGEWTCPGCMRSGCWPTKNTCFRCGTMRPNTPLPPGPVMPNSRPARAPREQRHPGRAPGVSPSGCPTERRTPPPRVSSAPSAPSVPAAAGLNLDVVVQFLRGLNVPSEILADLQNAVPPPAPKKTVHQLTKEQKCSQLRNKVDITKQQLSKLAKRVETLAKEHTEAAEKLIAKQTELAQLEVELEEARRLIMQPTPPATPPPSHIPRGPSSPRVSDVASSGMAVDAELLLPSDGEGKSPKRLRVSASGEEAPSLQQVLDAKDSFSAQDLASIIRSFQLRQSQLEDEENAISQREMESALGWSG